MSKGPSCVNMPMTTRNHEPERLSRSEISVTSSLTFTKFSYSRSSRVNIFMRSEPLTERVSLMTWFISSFLACASCTSLRRTRPAERVGSMSSGSTARPTMASFQLIEKSATSVVATTATLETICVSVPEMTELTPLMSVFMRVTMSPCFSVVKNECGMCCRWSYISFFISKMMRWLIQELM